MQNCTCYLFFSFFCFDMIQNRKICPSHRKLVKICFGKKIPFYNFFVANITVKLFVEMYKIFSLAKNKVTVKRDNLSLAAEGLKFLEAN